MNLIHGFATGSEAKKEDAGHLEWGIQIKNLSFQLLGTEIVWQPALKFLKDSDLIIVSQENRILLNYLLLIRKIFDHQKIAFWGHGRNFQNRNPRNPKELVKRFFLTKPDWWFAYTDLTKKDSPRQRITRLRRLLCWTTQTIQAN